MYRLGVVALAACRIGFDPVGGDGGRDGLSARTIHVTVHGQGGVASDPAGLACTDDCSADLAGAVTLHAFPINGWQVRSWSTCAGTSANCVVDASAPADITLELEAAPIVANRVFVTSTMSDGAIGNRAAADLRCNTLATTAGLGGTFVAYLGYAGQNALTPLVGSRGWVRMDNAPVLDTPTAASWLTQIIPIDRDEYGVERAESAWTGVLGDATSPTINCSDWTSAIGGVFGIYGGEAQVGRDAFADNLPFGGDCSELRRMFCFEVGRTIAVPPAATLPFGRYVFATQTTWTPNAGGVATADATCAGEALAAGVPGTFRAMVATTTQSVADRLGGLGGPWRHVGDALVTLGTLGGGGSLSVAVNVDVHGAPLRTVVWLGSAIGFDALGEAGYTCGDWTDPSAGSGEQGEVDNASVGLLFGGHVSSCGLPAALLCGQMP